MNMKPLYLLLTLCLIIFSASNTFAFIHWNEGVKVATYDSCTEHYELTVIMSSDAVGLIDPLTGCSQMQVGYRDGQEVKIYDKKTYKLKRTYN